MWKGLDWVLIVIVRESLVKVLHLRLCRFYNGSKGRVRCKDVSVPRFRFEIIKLKFVFEKHFFRKEEFTQPNSAA